jgi:hypothetical protein
MQQASTAALCLTCSYTPSAASLRSRERPTGILWVRHSTPISMANLASIYDYQGRWKEAETLQVQVLETSKRVLGRVVGDIVLTISGRATDGVLGRDEIGEKEWQEEQE